MKRIIFLITMLFATVLVKATDISYNVNLEPKVGFVPEEYEPVEVQSLTSHVVIEPVQCDLGAITMEYIVSSVSDYFVGFDDVGLKPDETFIPVISIISLNYHTGNSENAKYQYRCSRLRCDIMQHT